MAAGLVLLLVVAAVAWRAGGNSRGEDPEPAAPIGAPSELRAQRAGETLGALTAAWEARDRIAFLDAAGDTSRAREWAGRTYGALSLLDVTAMELRFVGERVATTAEAAGVEQTFAADVEVRWTYEGYPVSTSTVALAFGDTGSAVSVTGLAEGSASMVTEGAPLPLWLAGDLVAGGRCLGVDAEPDSIRCGPLTDVAAQDLAAVVPRGSRLDDWRIVLPATSSLASALLGRGAGGLGAIAAVTTTIDASGSPQAPQVVILNPDVMRTLRPDAAQLVVSHEAVHAATGAAAVDLPLWVAEGFADYVALRQGRVPVQRAASQLLDSVRRNGPPSRLPDDEDFSGVRAGLGQTYEAAWLVFRLLGEQYGDAAVVAFYEAVLAGDDVDRALAEQVGITLGELTAAWRAELVRLAG